MQSPDFLHRLSGLHKALGDENRLKMVGLLARRPRYGEELAELLELSPATVSHHLGRLREAGLVQARKEPPYIRYRLNAEVLEELSQDLQNAREWPATLNLPDEDHVSQRILNQLVDDGRLHELPAGRRKRAVVLRWLAHQFEVGRIYPEREVRRVLMGASPDFELLRELLLEEGWMRQQGGVYRRIEELQEE